MRRLALTLILLLVPAAVRAQAPVFLEPEHWSYDAIRRLNALGLAPPASAAALAPVTLQHAGSVFEFAATAARQADSGGAERLAAGYADLLRREAGRAGSALGVVELRVGWALAEGGALAGDGYFPDEDWQGARALQSASGPVAAVRAHGHARPWLSWQLRGGRVADDWIVPAASVGLEVGAFHGWLGRRRLHYGVGYGGGTVLGSGRGDVSDLVHRTTDTFDGIGVHVRDPFHFPSVLRFLGPARIEIVAGRLDRTGRVESPYVVFGRLTGSPFTDRITLGINRGAIFGGEGNPITAGRLLGLLVGVHGGEGGEFENQVFSVLTRFRPPLGPIAAELYAELGMDDTAGAIRDTPGIVAGVELGALPGLRAASLGIEHTQFPGSCCGNPIWYRSIFFRGSWADDGQVFAHPLGGHGREWLIHGRVDMPDSRLLLRGSAFARRRGTENLYAPERAGRSRGGTVGVEYATAAGMRIGVEALVERADDWSMSRISAHLSRALLSGR